MPETSITIAAGETLLWQSGPKARRKGIIIGNVAALFLLLASVFILQSVAFAILSLGLVLLNVLGLRGYLGVHYYITDRRIAKKRGLLSRRVDEIPLQSVSGIWTAVARRRGYVAFGRAEGPPVLFGSLSEDPETIKKIAEDAKSRLGSG